jgi:hypothetical protein
MTSPLKLASHLQMPQVTELKTYYKMYYKKYYQKYFSREKGGKS